MRRALLVAAVLLLIPTLGLCEDFVLVAKVNGIVMSGGNLRLSVEFGSAAGLWARIYSEPSHTLLLEAVDREWAAAAPGKAWLGESKRHPAAASVITAMPASPSVEIRPRPAGDQGIDVWVEGGAGHDGVLAAEALVGPGPFSFSVSVPASSPVAPWPLIQHCCYGGGCQEMCVNCKTSQFTCCLPCCEIYCGWAVPCCE